MSVNECGFENNTKFTLDDEYHNYVMFHLQLTYIYSTLFEFNKFLVLIVCQDTVHNMCS
jgi:hypothetical protein